MKFGLLLAYLNPERWVETVIEAERVGFESAWCSEHVVFPVRMERSPLPDVEHPPVPATTPVFDAFAVLSHLAARTTTMRLGTSIYLLVIRLPFLCRTSSVGRPVPDVTSRMSSVGSSSCADRVGFTGVRSRCRRRTATSPC